MHRATPVFLIPLLVTACAMPERSEPPAPIVESSRPAQQPVEVAPKPEPKPEPAPAEPRPTTVYAYTPPESIPDPEPEPPPAAAAPTSESAPATAAAAPKPAPQSPAKPTAPAPAPQTPAAPAKPPAQVAQTPKPVAPQQPAAAPQQPPAPAPVPAPTPAAPPAPEVAMAPPPSGLAPAGMPPAVDALAGRAEQQRQTGDYGGAAATLERALRIQPQEAYLWNRLARVRLEQGLGSQAGNLAARSNALAGDQTKLKQNNWEVIATVRRQSGDVQGALEAERMAGGG